MSPLDGLVLEVGVDLPSSPPAVLSPPGELEQLSASIAAESTSGLRRKLQIISRVTPAVAPEVARHVGTLSEMIRAELARRDLAGLASTGGL